MENYIELRNKNHSHFFRVYFVRLTVNKCRERQREFFKWLVTQSKLSSWVYYQPINVVCYELREYWYPVFIGWWHEDVFLVENKTSTVVRRNAVFFTLCCQSMKSFFKAWGMIFRLTDFTDVTHSNNESMADSFCMALQLVFWLKPAQYQKLSDNRSSILAGLLNTRWSLKQMS